LNRRTVQSGKSKKKEVGRLQQLRNTELTVEGRRALTAFKTEWTLFRAAVDGILQEAKKS